MNKMRQTLALAMAMCVAAAGSAQAAVYSFQQGASGYTGQTDTYTEYQGDWTYNWGGNPWLAIYNSGGSVAADPGGTGGGQSNPDTWQKLGLMRFDLSSVPTSYGVSSAQLSLTVYLTAAQTLHLRPILRSGLDFGTSNGAPESGAVSVLYSVTPTTGWGAANTDANPRSGFDYGAAFATATLNPGDTSVTFTLTSQARSWVSNPAGNFGFVITSDTVGSVFYINSAEALTVANRPLLTLDAFPIPEPGTFGLLLLGGALVAGRQRRRAIQA